MYSREFPVSFLFTCVFYALTRLFSAIFPLFLPI